MNKVSIKTNHGEIIMTLDTNNTPKTCKQFIQLCQDKYYSQTLFHRVIKDFVIQGGGLNADMSPKGDVATIENEADTGGRNVRGSVAMARTQDPHSASSQFFINLSDNAFLNHRSKNLDGWGYCVFARVTEGMDVVDNIAKAKTTSKQGHQDVPVEDIVIEDVTIITE